MKMFSFECRIKLPLFILTSSNLVWIIYNGIKFEPNKPI